MKTLKNHTILFDAECPMCKVYTQAFVSSGMLDGHGRQAYQQVGRHCPTVDMQRAVNEIALVNNDNGEVSYGIKSLFKILGHACPVFKPIFSCRPFVLVMEGVYALISYNRRVIIPAQQPVSAGEYQASFRLRYRLIYLFLTAVLAAAILTHYTPMLFPLLPKGNAHREYWICFGQLGVQGVLVSLLNRPKAWDYLGNMMTISLGGALLLLPLLILAHWIPVAPPVALVYFMVVVSLMFLEHIRRTRLLGVSVGLTVSWITYRFIVLLIIYSIPYHAIF